MSQYLATISLPHYLDEDFVALIPEQRLHVDTLMSKGLITSYSLSLDRTRLWVTFSCDKEKEVDKIIRKFPIAEYINYEISELAFHNSGAVFFPTMSLN